eukprot:scaffold273_cov349-Prasinococcus_capsulatus_cf.AAC.16
MRMSALGLVPARGTRRDGLAVTTRSRAGPEAALSLSEPCNRGPGPPGTNKQSPLHVPYVDRHPDLGPHAGPGPVPSCLELGAPAYACRPGMALRPRPCFNLRACLKPRAPPCGPRQSRRRTRPPRARRAGARRHVQHLWLGSTEVWALRSSPSTMPPHTGRVPKTKIFVAILALLLLALSARRFALIARGERAALLKRRK